MPDEEASPGEKVQKACGLCCCGFFTFPLALLFLGYKEKMFVCDQKNILTAEKDGPAGGALVVGCSSSVEDNQFVALSCPLDRDAFKKFTIKDFMADNPTFGDELFFNSLSAEMSAPEMMHCLETKTSRDDPSCTAKQKKEGSCPKTTTYSYKMQWSTGSHTTFENQTPQAKQNRGTNCPGLLHDSNPAFTVSRNKETHDPPAEVPLNGGKFYITTATGSSGFRPDSDVDLSPFASKFKVDIKPRPGDPQGFSPQNSAVVGKYLQTCLEPAVLGCQRVSFKMNRATSASLLANSGIGGRTTPQSMSASWGCSASKWYQMRPVTLAKEAFIAALHSSNESSLYAGRVFGVLACWAAVFCCLYPIIAFFDIMEDYLAMIPCIGGCLSVIGNIVETLVTMVVCCMSCSFGCSAAMFVVAIVWLVMRPWKSIPMIIGCILLSGGAYYMSTMMPKKQVGARDMSTELNSAA